MSAETRKPRWAPETDPQWGTRHQYSHQEKTTGTSWALTIWLCCSWNKLLVRLPRGELAPRLSLVSPKVFFSILSPMELWFLAAVASVLLSWENFISSDIVVLIAQILNWTELDNAFTENLVFNHVILHYWHNFPILILCSCFDTIRTVKSPI